VHKIGITRMGANR